MGLRAQGIAVVAHGRGKQREASLVAPGMGGLSAVFGHPRRIPLGIETVEWGQIGIEQVAQHIKLVAQHDDPVP